MEMFLLGFLCGNVSLIIGAIIGWFGHREMIHRPVMREVNQQACEAIKEARDAIAAAQNKTEGQ